MAGGRRSHCKQCNNAYYAARRITHYEKVREYEKKFHYERRLKYEYGITREDRDRMFLDQDAKCKICLVNFTEKSQPKIDHCHTSGKVRGLLCSKCNLGLGHFKDNPESLQRAIKYLKENSNA